MSKKPSHQPKTGISLMQTLPLVIMAVLLTAACARMGQPDGGWYDEIPPHVIKTTPADQSINVSTKKVVISFDEIIKVDNPTEKVVLSPPQLEAPEIKTQGNKIVVEIKDSLKPNTTYTIDFSDAITDNNEGNPMGNYTYSFSTGNHIDTLEVSGYVLDASNLEPVKGILVGLHDDLEDSAFVTKPILRVSRTDSRGHFVIKGVADGTYHVFCLQDMDANYMFSQKSEMIGFYGQEIKPESKPDIRQDTIWSDSLHIKSIERVSYTHFLPDDIVIRAFNEPLSDRYFVKSERANADRFTVYFNTGDGQLPTIHGVNFDEKDAFLIETTPKADTITYWIRDTLLVNRDTLEMEMTFLATDTLGELTPQTEILQLLSKQPYARRLKERQKKEEDWRKKEERKKRRGLPYDSIMPAEKVDMKILLGNKLSPDKNIMLQFATPIAEIDTSKIHLYARQDTLWYAARYRIKPWERTETVDTCDITRRSPRQFVLQGEWQPGTVYSLEMDSLAFVDLYGKGNGKHKQGFKVGALEDYGTFIFDITGFAGRRIVVQLLNEKDQVVKEVTTENGNATFFYVDTKSYYMRMFVDENGNGRWDTGDYASGRQPEEVYYYPKKMECRAKWDIHETWNPTLLPLSEQKPAEITKQKADQKRKISNRNAQRAKDKGIPLPADL